MEPRTHSSPPAHHATVTGSLRRYYERGGVPLTERQHRVMRQLTGCRTGRYGSRTHLCEHCDHGQVTLNSCSNRHCPRCGDGRRAGWQDRMAEIALNCPYLHTVFTTPHELNAIHDLDEANTAAMIRLIFDCVVGSTKKVLAGHGIGKPGLVMTLHTWGQQMNRHVHVHVVLAAGGLSEDGQSWVALDLEEQALEELKAQLAVEYRTMYLRRLARRIKADKIRMPGGDDDPMPAARQLIEKLRAKNWIINLQASPERWKGSTGIVNYLADYVAGTAISDRRLLEDDGQYVTIAYKDYRCDNIRKTERMLGEEFETRFASHILPLHCKRVRYSGLFAPQGRSERLEHCRRLLPAFPATEDEQIWEVGAIQESHDDNDEDLPVDAVEEKQQARRELFTGEGNHRRTFPATCRICKRYMEQLFQIDGSMTMRILPWLVRVMQWLSGEIPAPPKRRPEGVPLALLEFVEDELRAEAKRQRAEAESQTSSDSSAALDASRPPPEAT